MRPVATSTWTNGISSPVVAPANAGARYASNSAGVRTRCRVHRHRSWSRAIACRPSRCASVSGSRRTMRPASVTGPGSNGGLVLARGRGSSSGGVIAGVYGPCGLDSASLARPGAARAVTPHPEMPVPGFEPVVARFLDDLFVLLPDVATRIGDHRYD